MTDPTLNALLSDVDALRQLVLAWSPGKSQPVSVLFVRCNDALVTHDKLITDSPAVFRLPAPGNGQYTLTWAVSPEVAVSGLVLAVLRPSTGARVVVDSTGAKDRGELWSSTQGVSVNAP